MGAKLIAGIVPHGKGEMIAAAACAAGAGGGTLLTARGTAKSALLAALGLGETTKDVAVIFVDDAMAPRIRDAIVSAASGEGRNFGVLFSIGALGFGRGRFDASSKADTMEASKSTAGMTRLIGLIVNKGYADDAMAAARKAGATGGTVICGRGTAKPDDATFFGVALVPEKEVLVILADDEKADAILDSVRSLPCLAERGSGIAFCLPVTDFAALGNAG